MCAGVLYNRVLTAQAVEAHSLLQRLFLLFLLPHYSSPPSTPAVYELCISKGIARLPRSLMQIGPPFFFCSRPSLCGTREFYEFLGTAFCRSSRRHRGANIDSVQRWSSLAAAGVLIRIIWRADQPNFLQSGKILSSVFSFATALCGALYYIYSTTAAARVTSDFSENSFLTRICNCS